MWKYGTVLLKKLNTNFIFSKIQALFKHLFINGCFQRFSGTYISKFKFKYFKHLKQSRFQFWDLKFGDFFFPYVAEMGFHTHCYNTHRWRFIGLWMGLTESVCEYNHSILPQYHASMHYQVLWQTALVISQKQEAKRMTTTQELWHCTVRLHKEDMLTNDRQHLNRHDMKQLLSSSSITALVNMLLVCSIWYLLFWAGWLRSEIPITVY